MKIKTIAYSKSVETLYGYGLKKWDKFGCEVEIEEGDNPENAAILAKQFVNEQLYKELSDQESMKGTTVKDITPEEPVDSIQSVINEINACNTLEELRHCWLMSKGNLTLSAAYKEKEKQLKNA